MQKYIRQGNEQFEPKLYNNKINSAGFKSTCQSLGPKMSGGSSPMSKEAYGVNGISGADSKLFAGSYAPVKTTKLNQCGAGTKKKKSASKKKSIIARRRTTKKKKSASKKKKTVKRKTTKKKKSASKKKKSNKKKTIKKRTSLVSKIKKAFLLKGGKLESYTSAYSPDFQNIAPNNSALANPQSINRVNSCTSPNVYNHFTKVSK